MKRLFLLIALIVFVLRIDAQNRVGTFSIIPRVGVCIANMTGQDYYKASLLDDAPEHKIGSKYNSNFIFGVDVQYQILDKVALSLGAFYTRQGCRYTDDVEEFPLHERIQSRSGFVHNEQFGTVLDRTDDPGFFPVSEGKKVHLFFRIQIKALDILRRSLTAIPDRNRHGKILNRSASNLFFL